MLLEDEDFKELEHFMQKLRNWVKDCANPKPLKTKLFTRGSKLRGCAFMQATIWALDGIGNRSLPSG